MRRHRFGWWVLVVWLAAGCSQATTPAAVANDQADVWFLQHMVPYLRQTMVLSSLTRDQLGDPRLVRLAEVMTALARQMTTELQTRLRQMTALLGA